MKKHFFLAFILAAVLCTCLLAIGASAATDTVTASGTCGNNLTWILYSDGELIFDGTGAMTNWDNYSSVPWYSYRSQIKTAIIESGVTSIGDYAFRDCTSLTSVDIPDSVESIGSNAFRDCTSLTSVNISSIEAWCAIQFNNGYSNPLYYAHSLYLDGELVEDLKIPDGVTSIESIAFYSCTSLTSVDIPDSVESIGSSAFYGCTSLTKVMIYSRNTEFGTSVFNNTSTNFEIHGYRDSTTETYASKNGHKFVLLRELIASGSCGDNVTWELYSNGELIIDGTGAMTDWSTDSSSGYIIISQAPWYQHRELISSVIIGNGVTSIGRHTFRDCYNLTSVTIPDSVTTIGDSAFEDCYTLVSVTIPDSVESIGSSAFYDCYDLTSVTIPDSVESIGSSAFYYCTSLTSVNISSIEAWCTIQFSDGYSNPLYYAHNLYLDGVLVEDLKIPEGVTSIGDNALNTCTSLTSIDIPTSVENIGNAAFSGCTSLTNITVDANNTKYSSDEYGVLFNKEKTTLIQYPIGNERTEYLIPDGVENIEEYAFYNCKSLKSVDIPDRITSIGNYAFYGCTGLTSVTIGDSVTSIGSYAFYTCGSLTEIKWNAKNVSDFSSGDDIFEYAGRSGDGISVIFGDSVEHIPAYAFSGCTSLVNVDIGNGVTSIGNDAFSGCTSLVNVDIGNGVTSIGNDAFQSCKSLKSVDIPTSVENIGNAAFRGCTSLVNIDIGNGVTSIGDMAFLECTSLTSVDIGNGVTSIGNDAFYNCTSLANVDIGDNVEIIGDMAFRGCTSLTNVDIPDSVESIGSSAFSGCTKLKKVTIYSREVTFDSNYAFPKTNEGLEIHGYAGFTVEAYANANGHTFVALEEERKIIASDTCGNSLTWTLYSDGELVIDGTGAMTNWDNYSSVPWYSYRSQIKTAIIESGVTSIGDYAFYGYTSLKNVDIGNSVEIIGNYAFYECTSLMKVTIPDSVTRIGGMAFYECASLMKVTIPDSVEIIGDYAFYECTSLMKVTIPDSVEIIGNYAFSGAGLTSVDIGNGVTSIGYEAFYSCTSLMKVTIPDSVTRIGERAFYGCTSLTSVTIGENATSIGNYAFYDCTALTEIKWNAKNISGPSSSNNYIFTNAGQSGGGISVIFGDSVERIPGYLFHTNRNQYGQYQYAPKVTSVTIGDSVTRIGERAFYGCTSLKSVDIGCSVADIGDCAFYDCRALKNVNISSIGVWCAIQFGDKYSNPLYYTRSLYIDGVLVEDLIIPDGVTRIGAWAFYYWPSQASIDVPDSVTSIGEGAFYGWSNLTSVTIGNGVTSIGKYAFYDCTALTEIKWNAKKVSHFSEDNYIFADAGQSGDGINVIFGDSVEHIPAYVFYPSSGYSPKITSVTIGESVTSIGNYAFYNCAGMASATIGDSVRSIEDYAFYNCTGLASVTIGNSVRSIGDYAFYNCTGLASVTIGEGVIGIGKYAFYNCTALAEINWNAKKVSNFSNLPIDNKIFANAGRSGDGISVIFGDSVEYIPAYAFYDTTNCPKITSVTIGENVTSIGKYAFYDCEALTEIKWNAKNVSDFSEDNKIFAEAGEYGDGISVIFGDSVEHIPAYAFYPSSGYSPKITSVTIGESVTCIGNYAFNNCRSLTEINWNAKNVSDFSKDNDIFEYAGKSGNGISVIFGDSVEHIPAYAFYQAGYTPKITSVTIGENVTSIGKYTFYDCASLTQINWNAKKVSNFSKDSYIFADAGQSGDGISVIFGDSVEHIPAYAFYNCWNLTSITVDVNNTKYSNDEYGVLFNKDKTALIQYPIGNQRAEYTIPKGVTSIGDYAFYNCWNLTSITVDVNNTKYSNDEYGVLFNKDKTTLIQYPIGNQRTEYTIPKGVTSIGDYASYNCDNLESVTIPKSVTSIGDYAFSTCARLMKATIYSRNATFGARVFTYIADIDLNECVIYGYRDSTAQWYAKEKWHSFVALEEPTIITSGICGDNITWKMYSTGELMIAGSGAMNEWQTDFDLPWYSYRDQITSIVIEDGVTHINNYAFYNCTNLSSIVIPSSVTHIGNYAFYNCTNITTVNITSIEAWCKISFGDIYSNPLYYEVNLYINGELVKDLVIPQSVTYINNYAFYNYTNLTSVVIEGDVTYIGNYAFYNCTNITNIVLPNSVTSIGNNAFENCTGLTVIVIPESITGIGSNAFYNCTNITTVNITSIEAWCKISFGDIYANPLYYAVNLYLNGELVKDLTIPANVTYINNYAFYNCTSIASIVFDGSVTRIGDYAFYNCTNITNIVLPESIAVVGDYAFENCSSLVKVIIYSRNANFGSYTFRYAASTFEIHGYRKSTAETYANANGHKFVVLPPIPQVFPEQMGITIIAPDGGWKFGDITFTVKADFVCSVMISYDGGQTYVELAATNSPDGGCKYTANGVTEDTFISVTRSGDTNCDGGFDYYDVSKLFAFYRGKATLDGAIDTDINGDGTFDYYDVSKLFAIYRGKADFN